MKSAGARKRRGNGPCLVVISLCFGTAISFVLLASRSNDSRADQLTQLRFDERSFNKDSEPYLENDFSLKNDLKPILEKDVSLKNNSESNLETDVILKNESVPYLEKKGGLNGESGKRDLEVKTCATVEEIGAVFERGFVEPSLRVRRLIREHFQVHGPARMRSLQPEQFCRSGFVIGKAFQAGFGNEMYKILTGAALSIMLNRSLIIGQTRHIGSYSAQVFWFIGVYTCMSLMFIKHGYDYEPVFKRIASIVFFDILCKLAD